MPSLQWSKTNLLFNRSKLSTLCRAQHTAIPAFAVACWQGDFQQREFTHHAAASTDFIKKRTQHRGKRRQDHESVQQVHDVPSQMASSSTVLAGFPSQSIAGA